MTDLTHVSSQLNDTISLLSIISPNLLPEHRPAANRLISQLRLCCDSISVATCQCQPSETLCADVQSSTLFVPSALPDERLLDEYTRLRISTIHCSMKLMSTVYGTSSSRADQNVGEALSEAAMWLKLCGQCWDMGLAPGVLIA